ncbi:quinone oxidoreductase family protein [Parathalassolituus penaei]|uniref:Zinc-binding alcohol dehydrogenase family protein n=1 Tax=Parathalassolituus penaei TaxID=2997323 RepID=A0A9X3EEU5_9GAMM|nr:zinc-binding alcohol dehydrogenase family protein [Parathalassolituus penaei]MCY0966303.1 zinc-binding alcohol dehydrogenase family protein [Parathalassolituus penaei]
MKAVLVTDYSLPPVWGNADAPRAANADEVLVLPRAAAISQLVRAKASGRHYSSGGALPQVVGVDGVGALASGERVFFAFPACGSMAEQTLVKASLCVPVPDDLDDVTAAALANPGMSSLAALRYRAGFVAGDNVLINGAAGASGRLAIQIARYLGAGQIVVTARKPEQEAELLALGADCFVCLNQSDADLQASLAVHMAGMDIVLDYLGGVPAARILAAASSSRPLRFVNIGSLAGVDIPVNAGWLRGKPLTLMGSGLGSVPNPDLMRCFAEALQMARPAGLQMATRSMSMAQVADAWQYQGPERLVLTMAE